MQDATDFFGSIPPGLWAALGATLTGAIGYFSGRKAKKATIKETEAETDESRARALLTMTEVSDNLANQLKAFEAEVPVWKARIAEESRRADIASKRCRVARDIKIQAEIIIEELSHMSYLKDIDEPETIIERRFLSLKNAAKEISKLDLQIFDDLGQINTETVEM